MRYKTNSVSAIDLCEISYANLFENMLNGLAYCQMIYNNGEPADFVYLLVNPAFEKLTGLSDVVGKRVSEIIPGVCESDADLIRLYGRVATSGKPEVFEYYVVAMKMWFSISVYCPKKDHFLAIFDVTTAKKHADETIRCSEQQYRNLFESSRDALMLVNAKSFRYVDANQAALTLFGVSSLKDLTTLGPMGLSPERQPDGMLTIDKVKIETEKTLREGSDFFEWEHQRVDGQRFLADILLTRVDFLGEQFVLANVRDVSERKRLQQELERSEFNYRMLFEFAPAGMIAASPESGKILQANSKALSMFGYELDEIITKTLTDITYQEDLAVSDERNKRLAEGALHNLAFKKRYLRKDGSHFWAESFASALKDSNGKVIRFVGSIVDITERKLAEEKISSYLQQLERSMEGTLHAVSNMIEFRDPYTAGHERRVGIIAADIAREMGWPNERCKNLEYIGLVHDIGKIAIPAEILTKPSRLSCLEYEMVKGHAEKGYEVLKDVDFPLPIAEIIRQHHERMDGSGYPRGLRGEEILMEARIIAVADVLESIASHRPYRPALGVEVAIKEIEENKGTLFDEQVVVALLNLFRVKKYQLPV